jgi:hypothetical protein
MHEASMRTMHKNYHLNPAITMHSPVNTGTFAALASPFQAQDNYACSENGLPSCLCACLARLDAQAIAGFRCQNTTCLKGGGFYLLQKQKKSMQGPP